MSTYRDRVKFMCPFYGEYFTEKGFKLVEKYAKNTSEAEKGRALIYLTCREQGTEWITLGSDTAQRVFSKDSNAAAFEIFYDGTSAYPRTTEGIQIQLLIKSNKTINHVYAALEGQNLVEIMNKELLAIVMNESVKVLKAEIMQ